MLLNFWPFCATVPSLAVLGNQPRASHMFGKLLTNWATHPQPSIRNILEFYSCGLYNADLNPKTLTHSIAKFRSTDWLKPVGGTQLSSIVLAQDVWRSRIQVYYSILFKAIKQNPLLLQFLTYFSMLVTKPRQIFLHPQSFLVFLETDHTLLYRLT